MASKGANVVSDPAIITLGQGSMGAVVSFFSMSSNIVYVIPNVQRVCRGFRLTKPGDNF